MREFSNHFTVANRVRMLRCMYRGAILLVEGDTEARFFGGLAAEDTRIIAAKGKADVIAAFRVLESGRVAGVLAVIDADYEMLNGGRVDSILVTDTHDLETLMIRSRALRKVAAAYLQDDAIPDAGKIENDLRAALLAAGTRVGCLRWANDRKQLRLNFDGIDLGTCIDWDSMSVRRSDLVAAVCDNSRGLASRSCAEIELMVAELESRAADPWMVCQGHDLARLLALLLPSVLGRMGYPEAAEKARRYARYPAIQRELHLAYEARFFRDTRLYAEIRGWERLNPPYVVLAPDV